MAGAKSHEELVTWQLCRQLKLGGNELVRTGPITRDRDLCDQLERAARNAPRAIAEGFGRYLPADFIRYLHYANGEVKEVLDALQDAVEPTLRHPGTNASTPAARETGYARDRQLHRVPANVHAAERIAPAPS